jgi:hypothetical protein
MIGIRILRITTRILQLAEFDSKQVMDKVKNPIIGVICEYNAGDVFGK